MRAESGAARVAIVDYGMGNLFSVSRALRHVGLEATICDSPGDGGGWDALIIPGVGAMPQAMETLHRTKWASAIAKHAAEGRPTLGICLGMQLLFEKGSENRDHEGLGLIPGSVVRFPSTNSEGGRLLVPHIGWNAVSPYDTWDNTLLAATPSGTPFYFVHSYYCVPDREKHLLGITEYGGVRFCSAVRSGNTIGCQFHPERSGPAGLRVLSAFRDLVEEFVGSELQGAV